MFKKSHFLFIISILLLVTVVLAACGGQADNAASAEINTDNSNTVSVPGGGFYTDITSDGLAAMLENKDFPLINVHIPYAGEIAETDQFIPFNEMVANADKLPTDKNAQIVVYCRSGGMSAQAAQDLVMLGYTNVWNLDGGMIDWVDSGQTLIQNGS